MPYSVGEQGSYGCSGYPVISDYNGEVESVGCHDSAAEAAAQIAAIEANENKDVGIKDPEEWPEVKSLSDSNGMPSATGQPHPASTKDSLFEDEEKTETGNSELVDKQAPCWDGYVQRGMKPGANGSMVPNCIPVAKKDSSIFSDFGKDFTNSTRITNPFI